MSPVFYKNCQKCDQPIEVHELPNTVVFVVGGLAVTECPMCGLTLTYEEMVGNKPLDPVDVTE